MFEHGNTRSDLHNSGKSPYAARLTMPRPKQDVLVHYDEANGELVFYTVPSEASAELRTNSFGGIRPSAAELQSVEPLEAMRRVGGTVLALIDLSSQAKLGITSVLTQDAPPSEA